MKRQLIGYLFVCSLLLLGCGGRHEERRTEAAAGGVLEQIDGIAILNLDAPAFASLPLDARRCAYYLSQAVLAGRDIAYDQIHPRSVEIRTFLEKIGQNITYAAPDYYVKPFLAYLKTVWIHGGFYELATGKKLQPQIGDRELSQLIFLALANSGGQLGSLQDINLKRNYILDTLFNQALDSTLLVDFEARDANVLVAIPQDFYEGVTVAEILSFRSKYSHNSRLVKRGDRLVELVYRTGDEELAPGPYARELDEVIENLEKARPYLTPNRVPVIDLLIEHFRTGDPSSFDSAAGILRHTSAPLDFVVGFDDRRFDPLHQKGLWTGILFIADDAAQAQIDKLEKALPDLLASFPGGRSLLARQGPLIKAAQLLTAVGANSPLCPDVYRDPAYRGGSELSGQGLIFTNVVKQRAAARAMNIQSEFCFNQAEVEQAKRFAPDLAVVKTGLGELLSLSDAGLGSIARRNTLPPPEFLRMVEEEAALLWLLHDSRLIDAGLLPAAQASDEAYRSFARDYLVALASDESTLRQQATCFIAEYLLATGNALSLERKDGRTFCRLLDSQVMRRQLAELAGQIGELLQTKNPPSLEAFVAKYTGQNTALREEVAGRLARIRAFTEEAFVLPLVEAQFNPMGGLDDVKLRQPASFTEEMLIFSGFEPPREKNLIPSVHRSIKE